MFQVQTPSPSAALNDIATPRGLDTYPLKKHICLRFLSTLVTPPHQTALQAFVATLFFKPKNARIQASMLARRSPPFISAVTRLTAFLNSYSPALIFSFGLPVGNNFYVTIDTHLT